MSKSRPLAIVIPAYKQRFLRDTLASIASQTCKDFTLYIGDDCSPYSLKPIIDEFTDTIPIIYHRFEDNMGGKDLVGHWERCIALSADEPYIWLFSDDDIMEPHCVEEFFKLPQQIRENHLIHFDIAIIDDSGVTLAMQHPFPSILKPKEFIEGKLGINGKSRFDVFVVEFIFSRRIYEENDRFQNYDLAWGTDFITWLKFSTATEGIFTINHPDCRVLWRKSRENITPNTSRSIIARKLKSLIYNASYINKWLLQHENKAPFRYTKFVWGNIWDNVRMLSLLDIISFKNIYIEEVGHPVLATLVTGVVLLRKAVSSIGSLWSAK